MFSLTINDPFVAQRASYEEFAKIQNIITACNDDIRLLLNTENRLGYSFVFLFATLPYLAEKHNKVLEFYCNSKNYNLFKKLGFLKDCNEYRPNFDYSNELKKSVELVKGTKDIVRTVTEISIEAPVKMSPKLESIFVSKAGEMYNNAIEHSYGDVFGAKYFRNQKNTYCFSCYDNGIGIPDSVMKSQNEITNQIDAFKWAMTDGNSTASTVIPRGLGLGLLKAFARANEGVIRISSGNVLYIYKRNDIEQYYFLKEKFIGTLFEMDIIADNNRRYIIK